MVRSQDADGRFSEHRRIELEAPASAIALHPSGHVLAAGDVHHRTRLYDLRDANRHYPDIEGDGMPAFELLDFLQSGMAQPDRYDNLIRHLAFDTAPGGNSLLKIETPYSTVSVWDWRRGTRRGESFVGGEGVVKVTQTPDGKVFLLGGAESIVRRVRASDAKLVGGPLFHRTAITHVVNVRDTPITITASADGEVRFWDEREDRNGPSAAWRVSDSPVQALALSRDDFFCATGDAAGQVQVWLAREGVPLCEPFSTGAAVRDLVFDSRNGWLFAACADGKVHSWEILEGKPAPLGSFTAMAQALGNLYVSEDREIRVGSVFYRDRVRKQVDDYLQKDRDNRNKNPNFRSDDFRRALYEHFGMEPLPEPEWITKGSIVLMQK